MTNPIQLETTVGPINLWVRISCPQEQAIFGVRRLTYLVKPITLFKTSTCFLKGGLRFDPKRQQRPFGSLYVVDADGKEVVRFPNEKPLFRCRPEDTELDEVVQATLEAAQGVMAVLEEMGKIETFKVDRDGLGSVEREVFNLRTKLARMETVYKNQREDFERNHGPWVSQTLEEAMDNFLSEIVS